MKTIEHSTIVPFSTHQMYDLINDIEQYPHFLPWCPEAKILHRTDTEIKATVHFAQGVFGKSFTTINRLVEHQRVEMRLVEGPFSHLEGAWDFQTLEKEGSKITFRLAFEFKNSLLSMTVGPIFQKIANTMIQAFTDRAHQIYATS